MALMPRRVKHRKSQRRRIKGNATRGNTVAYGEWGLLYIRIFPQKSVTARPLETRMGKGKGEPDHWVAVVKPGMIMFELAGVSKEAARECFARVAYKLPVRVRLIGRRRGS